MKFPLFSDPQFLDASATGGLNPAIALLAGSFSSLGSGAFTQPGLLSPEAMVTTFSGLTINTTLAPPFGIVTSGGLIVRAHGTQTAADTQSYTTSFASLVPSSGSVTAYLAATITQIQQTPFPISGPPPGHPAYDPTFTPTIGYAASVYSVALSAVSGGIDNVNTFEVARTTLTAGQVAISTINTLGQMRAPNWKSFPGLYLTSGGSLAASQLQEMIVPLAGGLTYTLPAATGSTGLMAFFTNPTTGTCTIAAAGTDVITGFSSAGLTSMSIPASGTVALWADGAYGYWHVTMSSPGLVPHGLTAFTTPGTYSWTCPLNVTTVEAFVTGGGGGGAGCEGSNTSQTLSGGGGGAGGTANGKFTVTPGTAYSVIVGAAGVPSLGPGSAGNGGTSSFGTFCSGFGGQGAVYATATTQAGGQGGSATSSATCLGILGGWGSDGQGGNAFIFPGNGGASWWGGGGRASAAGNEDSTVGGAFGGGGGGAYDAAESGNVYNGASGSAGVVMLKW